MIKNIKITATDKKYATITIDALNDIDKNSVSNTAIAISAFNKILSPFQKAYETKNKEALCALKFVTLKTKKNKKGKVTTFIDQYLLPQKRMSDLYIYASATANDRKKALSKKESLQNTANNIRKIQADRKKAKLEKEINNCPTKKVEALQEAYTKQLEKIENSILNVQTILENKELTINLNDRIKTFEKLSLQVRNCLLITQKDYEAFKVEEMVKKGIAIKKSKNNKNLNSVTNVNGIYLNTQNTKKIIAKKQEALDLEAFETQRKNNNKIKQAFS